MSVVQKSAKDAFEKADIDLLVDTIRAVMVDDTYVYDESHDFLNDVPSGTRVGSPVTLTGKSVSGGWFNATIPPFTSVASGRIVKALWIYKWTGVESTSPLIDFKNRRADTSLLALLTNGGDITFTVGSSGIFRL